MFSANHNRAVSVLVAGLMALLALCSCHHRPALPYYVSADFTPIWATGNKAESLHRIAPFSLRDQNGQIVTDQTFAGRIYLANFFFTTCPGICPLMNKNFEALQLALRDDPNVLFLSHSVTPEMDSVPVLRKYATEYGAIDGKWHLVTGSKKDIYTLARESYFADESKDVPNGDQDFLHTEKMFLIDRKGRIRGVYNGVLPAEMNRIKEDVKVLEKE